MKFGLVIVLSQVAAKNGMEWGGSIVLKKYYTSSRRKISVGSKPNLLRHVLYTTINHTNNTNALNYSYKFQASRKR